MRFMLGWDGSEVSNTALKLTISSLLSNDDQLSVYHCTKPSRHPRLQRPELQPESLQKALTELKEELNVQGEIEVDIEEKEGVTDQICNKITSFAEQRGVDVLVLGSEGSKADSSSSVEHCGISSSGVAAAESGGTTVLVRPSHKIKDNHIFAVALDAFPHPAFDIAKKLCKVGDQLEVHIVGTKSYTDPIKFRCLENLQQDSGNFAEYSVIPSTLPEKATIGSVLAHVAEMLPHNSFMALGAKGTGLSCDGAGTMHKESNDSLGTVAKWCLSRAGISIIVAGATGEC